MTEHCSNPQLEIQLMAGPSTDRVPEQRERRVQDNLSLMRRYFDLLYTENLDAVVELVDDDIEWFIVPTGDVISARQISPRSPPTIGGPRRTGPRS